MAFSEVESCRGAASHVPIPTLPPKLWGNYALLTPHKTPNRYFLFLPRAWPSSSPPAPLLLPCRPPFSAPAPLAPSSSPRTTSVPLLLPPPPSPPPPEPPSLSSSSRRGRRPLPPLPTRPPPSSPRLLPRRRPGSTLLPGSLLLPWIWGLCPSATPPVSSPDRIYATAPTGPALAQTPASSLDPPPSPPPPNSYPNGCSGGDPNLDAIAFVSPFSLSFFCCKVIVYFNNYLFYVFM